uniref:Serine/threonine-protein phosphatase 1 regulatory subunit 10 n=1 Tax=Eptatretus burgeri TaxID=7764 RepID=A0A8C4Q965_EPTBU
MAVQSPSPVDPKELLKGLECFLGKAGEIKGPEEVPRIYSLMKDAKKLVSRCIYLNILLQTKSTETLNKFIAVGGYRLLNSWLAYAKTTDNAASLLQILLSLKRLPLTVIHLKQNNTAKIVKQLSKFGDCDEVKQVASSLVSGWMSLIRSQSTAAAIVEKSEKRKKEEAPAPPPFVAEESRTPLEEVYERRKLKAARTATPSHTKFRSTGLEEDVPLPTKVKKGLPIERPVQKLLTLPTKRPAFSPMATSEKKYKPLNMNPNTTKEIRVKIIPAQPIESSGFMEALNSAPVPGVKIKKKKKSVSPTGNKANPFDGGRPVQELEKSLNDSPSHSIESMEINPPANSTDVDPDLDPEPEPEPEGEPMDFVTSTDVENESSTVPEVDPVPVPAVEPIRSSRKKKTVSWAEESKLREFFYFEMDDTERVNVNKVRDFGEAAKRDLLMDRRAFETARRLSHDSMEERTMWTRPRLLAMLPGLAVPGKNSMERRIQQEREMQVLQELFLTKDSVPDSPHEPDPEPYDSTQPKIIPLEDASAMDTTPTPESSQQPPIVPVQEPVSTKLPPVLANLMGLESVGSKLPPVLANLVSSMAVNKAASQSQPVSQQVAAGATLKNVQELLSTIISNQGGQLSEEMIRQPELGERIKQVLAPLQQGPPPPVMPVMPPAPGHPQPGPPMMPQNGMPFPMPHGGRMMPYPPGPRPPFPGPPRMMGPPPPPPPPPSVDKYWDEPGLRDRGQGTPPNIPQGHCMRGCGRGYRGQGRPLGNSQDMSNRPICRHFMGKGHCRYESNCAFYHPGVNGPPLALPNPPSGQ